MPVKKNGLQFQSLNGCQECCGEHEPGECDCNFQCCGEPLKKKGIRNLRRIE